MKVSEIVDYLEDSYPLALQESYDNSGLLYGRKDWEVTSILVCLDAIESVIDEAISLGSNLVIAHHPIIFKGLKKLTGSNYVERVIEKCIQHKIALYAIHTNLDNHYHGVNREISNRLGLRELQILSPIKQNLSKLVVFVPKDSLELVDQAIFEAGGGEIGNYEECHFRILGTGTFKPNHSANPAIGELGKRTHVEEYRVEYLVNNHHVSSVLTAMKRAHPYEEVAYEIYPIQNENHYEGAGMIGVLENSMDEQEFLNFSKPIADIDLGPQVVVPVGESPIDNTALYRNFQYLFRSLMTVNSNNGTTNSEYFNTLGNTQLVSFSNTIKSFLEYDVMLKYGNPANYKRRVVDSFIASNNGPFISLNPIV